MPGLPSRPSKSEPYVTFILWGVRCWHYDHKLCVVNERTRSHIEVAKMTFLHGMAGLSLRDGVICKGLIIEPLLLHVKRSQKRWCGHLVRMPSRRLPGLHLLTGFVTLWYLSGGFGGSGQGEECQGFPANTAAPTTQTPISRWRRVWVIFYASSI